VATAESSPDVTPLANAQGASAAFGIGGDTPADTPLLLPAVTQGNSASSEVQKLTDSAQITQERVSKELEAAKKAAEEAARPRFIRPAQGTFTSGFGARWGASHYGIDIANAIGTPIVAAADGTVIDAGPASGFGLWVRIKLPDGTINVYGHMNCFSVHVGQKVRAGEQIAEIGNRGESTGPHLHFEVWNPDGKKIDPRPWLAARGVTV
jgi:murein DD-endopeptidase MepM/ murein hydrolase activator NlpD